MLAFRKQQFQLKGIQTNSGMDVQLDSTQFESNSFTNELYKVVEKSTVFGRDFHYADH